MAFYPTFHPNRPRFFNMATLYRTIIPEIKKGLEREFSFNGLSKFLDQSTMADESYVRWEANGGVDLQLPGFKLTNRQMLWVSFLFTAAQKFIRNFSGKANAFYDYFNKNVNFYFKLQPNFREAFQCGNLTSMDKKQIAEFYEDYRRQKL